MVIQSTAVYEALHLKKTAVIYRRQSYMGHKSVFETPNVFLVDNEDELLLALDKNFEEQLESKDVFFKDFDSHLFEKFIKNKSRVTT